MERPRERTLRIGIVGRGFMGSVHSLAWRTEIATAAPGAGKHVRCEKPLARTSEEALMLRSAAAVSRPAASLPSKASALRAWRG
jgi:predicted dehydrogenase